MRKSFFQRNYNITIRLTLLGAISYLLSIASYLLNQAFDNVDIAKLKDCLIFVQDKLTTVEHCTKFLAVISMIVAVLLIVIELIQRFFNDSVWNYFKSVYQTMRLRQFLRQDEKSKSVITIDSQTTVTKFNPILKTFNKAVSKCTVDVRKDSVTVFIRYPKTQQAQKLLREMETHIKEEVSSRNPDYYFSSPSREKSKLWIVGTRR
ncbi:hypothetical protein [Streptococcus hyointestinalis]|uniref:hypothetical protein n=1 Tax=Streptococcus hyointestinalis TaxID=1337 RepID=UPI003D03194A